MIYFPTELFLVAEPLSIYGLPLMAEVRFSEDTFSDYPPEIRVSSQQSTISYRLLSRYYAVHYSQPQAAASEAILHLNDGAIAPALLQADRHSVLAIAVTVPHESEKRYIKIRIAESFVVYW